MIENESTVGYNLIKYFKFLNKIIFNFFLENRN